MCHSDIVKVIKETILATLEQIIVDSRDRRSGGAYFLLKSIDYEFLLAINLFLALTKVI